MLWKESMEAAEASYMRMRSLGLSALEARVVLPNSTKTEIIVYASIPEWRHIIKLRNSPAADPSMREVMQWVEYDFKVSGWL